MPIEFEQSASQPAAAPKTQRSSRMVPEIAIVMGLALWFSGAERYRGLLVSLFMIAGLCVCGLMLVRGLRGWQKATWGVLSVIWVCWMILGGQLKTGNLWTGQNRQFLDGRDQ